ncbi:hypothetical protein F4604DRAFT_1691479 [Suillus subluteus]|nr:hypothetical protein F4604DRAFT_1691479 [Suillus subluteus]
MDSSPCCQCAYRGYLEMSDHTAVALPSCWCASGTYFSMNENPATYCSMCALCNGAYYVHVPTPTQAPITPIICSGYDLTMPPPSPLSSNTGAPLITPAPLTLQLLSPPHAPASGTTNDCQRAPHGVSASPLTSVPIISCREGRSGNPTRSSTAPRRQLTQRTTQPIKYLVVIHPEPVYGTVTTDFDQLFRELQCPLWNKNFHPDIHEENMEFTCSDGCSEQSSADSDMDFDVPDFAPLTSADTTNVGASLFLAGPIMPFDGPASSAPSSPGTATSIIVHPPVASQPCQQSPTAAVAAWRGRIAAAQMTMRSLLSDDPATITISANTASIAAQSFIDAVESWCCPEASTDEQSMGATLTGLTLTSIVTGEFDVSIGDGIGHGVLRSFWSEVIRMIMEDSRHWKSTCDGYLVPTVTSLPPCDEDIVLYQAYGIIFWTAMLMDLEILSVSPILVLFLLSDYTTATTSSFTTAVAPIGSQCLLAWPPPLVTDAVTGQLELSIVPAMDLYSMILEVDASAQAFDCLIGDHLTLCEHILTEDLSSTILEGMFGGHILSSPEQVICLLVINVIPVGGIFNDIITQFKLHLECYLHGCGTPTQNDGLDLFREDVVIDPLLWTRLFLWCVTGIVEIYNVKGIHIHTCFYAVDVLLNESSMLIVNQEILADTSISTGFDRWIHSCISGNALDHYNTSAHY